MKRKIGLCLGLIILLSACTNENLITKEKSIEKYEVASKQESHEIVKESSADKIDVINKEEGQSNSQKETFEGYTLLEVSGGDTRGERLANVVVDVGYGDREYWAFTNEYGQLVRVIADEIVLQDDSIESVNANGRYYDQEAYVSGVEADDLDQGHVIADSLGGVSNAYNITPQNSTLNRHGDQAYMEKVMRQAGGSTNFEAIITYPNTQTQIPSHYKYTYYIKGNYVELAFANENPDQSINENINNNLEDQSDEAKRVSEIDTNKNNQISIKEAKSAGFSMPIDSNHWLYKYMTDGDGDGFVGE